MKLYHFSRSSASLRVRTALAFKGIDCEMESVSLPQSEHLKADYGALHPQHLVPSLRLDDGRVIIQSLPIIEFLEESFPADPLLPADPYARYYVRAVAQMVASEMHPLNNMRVIRRLRDHLNIEQSEIDRHWIPHWLSTGFGAVETFIGREALHGRFVAGEQFTLADICIAAQVVSAERQGFSIAQFPVLAGIAGRCSEVEAMIKARAEAL
ncbi:maleylacetoacetate isomerase [Paraburkholderia caffeinilytica]|uniref:maleylacetoacetate isomerase n=1 Tax=Paraburkholderia caffeinilytica TaxID=1761016 RepID=UPI0038BB4400